MSTYFYFHLLQTHLLFTLEVASTLWSQQIGDILKDHPPDTGGYTVLPSMSTGIRWTLRIIRFVTREPLCIPHLTLDAPPTFAPHCGLNLTACVVAQAEPQTAATPDHRGCA